MEKIDGRGKQNQTLFMLVTIFLGYTCLNIDKDVIGMSVVTIAQDLGLDASQKGLILSAFFLGYTLLQIPFGYFSSKVGTRKILISSIILTGLFLVFFGFGFSLLYLILIRFFSGAIAHAGYPSSVSTFISQEVDKSSRGPVQSTMIASAGLSAIIGPIIVAPVLTKLGWQSTYYILGALVIIVGIVMYFAIPKHAGQPQVYEGATKKLPFWKLLKDRNVLTMIVSAFFLNATVYGLTAWLATFLIEAYKLSMNMMAVVSAIIGLFTLLAAVIGGIVINKYFLNKEKKVVFVSTIIGGISVYLVSLTTNIVSSMIVLTIAVACSSLSFSTLLSMPVKLFPQDEVAAKYATINSLGVFGAVVAPTVIGGLVQAANGDFTGAFIFLSVTFVLAGTTALLIKNDRSKA